MKKCIKKVISCASVLAVCAAAFPVVSESSIYAEETYSVRDPFYNYNSGYNYYESEHFQFIWGNSGDSAKVTQEFLEGNARNLEACWNVYMNELDMTPPSQSTNISQRDGKQYKTNIYISGTGLDGMQDDWAYMSYDSDGFAYMFCCVDSMQYNPPSWVLPHEFGHVLTAHQLGWNNNKYSYAWWEAMGNWYREQYLYSDYSDDETGHGTDFFETYLKNMSLTFPCGRDYYASWPFLQYLTENPDNLDGYGADFVKKMLQEGKADEYPFDIVERLAPADLKDTLGNYAKHMAGLDFKNGNSYRARLDELLQSGSWNWQQIYTMPEAVAGQKNTYQVPTQLAPQFAGINIIPLKASGGTVSVRLNGLTDVKGADWRACIVQQSADGTCTYSELFSDGDVCSAEILSSSVNVWLTVIATPDNDTYTKAGLPYGYDSEFAEEKCSFMSKERYPYSIEITGADIKYREVDTSYIDGHIHSNGGGFVASTAQVDESVYVAPDAKVLGYARVSGNAKILDHAVVQDSAVISDNAVIAGYSIIAESAEISGNARVDDYALVMGSASVSGNAKVIESACVYGKYHMSDNSCAKGMAFCMADGSISGQGTVDGDYYDDGGKTVSKGTAYGWVSSQQYVDSLDYTDKLIAAYDFDSESSCIFNDRYTSTYGTAYGNPLWSSNRTGAEGVITFNGKNQYASLDRSVLYTDNLDLQTAYLPASSAGGQTLLYLGNDTNYIKISAVGENGCPEVIFSNGEVTEKLTSSKRINKGEWTVLRVVLDGDNGKLIINGEETAQSKITLNPSDIADSISVSDKSAAYRIAADNNGENKFSGNIDFLRVYSSEAQSPSEKYTEHEKPDDEKLTGDVNSDGIIDIFDMIQLKNIILKDNNSVYDMKDVVILKKYLCTIAEMH